MPHSTDNWSAWTILKEAHIIYRQGVVNTLLEACAHLIYRVTEADLRLFPTLIRYDSVYANLFKCSKRRVGDYPRLKEWLREMYNLHVGDGKGMQV